METLVLKCVQTIHYSVDQTGIHSLLSQCLLPGQETTHRVGTV
jgi:hypothetical protein